MAFHSRISSRRKTSAVTLAILAISAYGLCLPGASTAQAEKTSRAEHAGAAENTPLPAPSGNEQLTELEQMELHYRRYSAAAAGTAQLFKQLSQKIEDVMVAAKAVEVKSSSHNKRVLEDKLRQLESARTNYNLQYVQLHGQMQNENRSYVALAHDLKNRYGDANAPKGERDAKAKQTKGKDGKPKDSRTREARQGDVKGQDPKIVGARTVASRNREKDKQAPDLQGGEWDAKDPRVIDLDTKELRKRRDEATKPESAPAMNTVP
ncbi:MAG TPA: hypothetical protein VHB01_08390 [Nitrosospira sp.]|jgi:hypothetical protein|nr:hypothetical protein [Nitrosospira sp.]